MSASAPPARVAAMCALIVVLFLSTPTARAGTYFVQSCSYYGSTAPSFRPSSTAAHLSPSNECMVLSGGAYRSLEINENGGPVLKTFGASWSTMTPSPAIMIVNVFTPVNSVLVDCSLTSDGFRAQYFWGDGGQNYGTQPINYINGCTSGIGYADGISRYITPSRAVGWDVSCSVKVSCSTLSSNNRILGVHGIRLEAEENSGPALDPVGNNLWYRVGWVRGTWPLTLDATDPSGVCVMATYAAGQPVTAWLEQHRDASSWTQCHGAELPAQLDTTKYPDGHLSLAYEATNAAGVASNLTRDNAHRDPILVDNAPVSLSLTGPTDAPSTAGTQYVTATATAGPSGVAGIACSTDGSHYRWHPGASAQVPVAGLGGHQVACFAQNDAMDSAGVPAMSPTQTWSLTIRQPTVFGIGFVRLVDALRCVRSREKIEVPARWVTVRRHGKPVRVRRPAHVRVVRAMRCHARTARRRVTVWTTVHRHGQVVRVGHSEFVRVVVPPHVVSSATRRLAFGQGAIVSGWLGTSDGTALAGEPIQVLTAADNGEGRFAQAAVVSTGADGSWSALLAPGPSRLVEAVYGGSATTEPAVSGQARLVVRARVLLTVRPTRSHWGGTIHISGRVLGGYIPEGKLLRLRIGADGIEGTVGIPDVDGQGRFHTTWAFASGSGTVRYWFSVSTLSEADYPFAPASSHRVYVTVSSG
jgi:hypothetical protein